MMENGAFKISPNGIHETVQYQISSDGGQIDLPQYCSTPNEYCGTSISACEPQFGILPFRGLPCQFARQARYCNQQYLCEPSGPITYTSCGVYDGDACACKKASDIDGVNCCGILITRSVEGVLDQDVSWCGRVIWPTENKNDPGYITGTCVYLCDTPPW